MIIDNSGLIIPFYDTIPSDAKYPCDTVRMKYNKEDHRYYLTEAGLSYHGIDCAPQKTKKLIMTASDHIYSYIEIMAQTKYNLMCYRIAKSFFGRFKSEREGRLEFERKLAAQADYINEYGDAKRAPKMIVNPESGRLRDNDTDMSTGFWLDDGVLIWLKSNYLTDPNAVGEWQMKLSEY